MKILRIFQFTKHIVSWFPVKVKAIYFKSEHNLFIFKLIALVMSWFANMQVCKSELGIGFFIHTYYWTSSFQKCWHSFPIDVVRHYYQVKGYVSLLEVVFLFFQWHILFQLFIFSQISSVVHPSGLIKFKNFPAQIYFMLWLLLPRDCSIYF